METSNIYELKLRTTFEEEDDVLYETGEETIYIADLVSNKRISILHNDAVEDENQDDSVDEVSEQGKQYDPPIRHHHLISFFVLLC